MNGHTRKIRRRALLLALILLLALSGGCGAQTPPDTGEPLTVLCYGDSNTYGYDPATDGDRYPRELLWTTQLGERLGGGYDIVVEGLNGRTTAYDRPDGAWKNGLSYLTPCLVSQKPVDWLILMLGTNDCNTDLGLSPGDIAEGMEQLILTAKRVTQEYQGYVPRILVVAPAAIRPEIAGTPFEHQIDQSSVEKSRALAPLYAALAAEHGCLFLDATDELEVTELDCEHLTEKGHARLAELLGALIAETA